MRPRIIWFGRHYGTSSRCFFPVIIMPTAKAGRYAASPEGLLRGGLLKISLLRLLEPTLPLVQAPHGLLSVVARRGTASLLERWPLGPSVAPSSLSPCCSS